MITPNVPGGTVKLLTLVKGGTTTLTVPATRIYYLAWAFLYYTTSADVGDRAVRLSVTAVNLNVINITAPLTIAASASKTVGFNLSSTTGTALLNANAGSAFLLPLYPAQVLGVTAVGAFAGDTWSVEGIYYEVPLSCP